MAVAPIIWLLLIAVITRYKCERINDHNHNNGKGVSQFGQLLQPPPPPPLSKIVPVPFHGGVGRSPKQNVDAGYYYQPPPPVFSPANFKIPAPFHKQYNFNFVPPPQPFSTTPSPSFFQKVSSWLFPSQQTEYDIASAPPPKKDCNPCNLVPWIPVIRYNVGAKQLHQNIIPSSQTVYINSQNVLRQRPQSFYPQNQEHKLAPGLQNGNYGPPKQSHGSTSIEISASTHGSSSPTHVMSSETHGSSNSYLTSSSSYNVPSKSTAQTSASFNLPVSSYNAISSTYKPTVSESTTSSPLYGTPHFSTTIHRPSTPRYESEVFHNVQPHKINTEILRNTEFSEDLQLPKVSQPVGFKNSYGELITNIHTLGVPFPSATAAESLKIKTEISPHGITNTLTPNVSLALANPAPFTLNRGRNIHTLQPVALPNLSVSPLPPIFNARPFRPISKTKFTMNYVQGTNYKQHIPNTVNIAQSVSLAEFTHSVDYPTTIIESPIIDIDASKNSNQSKAFRNIPNGFVLDEFKDISSQASEDHISTSKTNQDASFESTGVEMGNDINDRRIPTDLKPNSNFPSNHKPSFADLRGIKDEDVDKYRTESNLQNIDSPLLYLKPSAPHKDFGNFVFSLPTHVNHNEYEMYDDIPTTVAPHQSTLTNSWDESKTDNSEVWLPQSVTQEEQPKILQIIIPYTSGQQEGQNNNFEKIFQDWQDKGKIDYQGRKVPFNAESVNTATESHTTSSTTTEESLPTVTENYESDKLSTPAILNDLYDVKEPPFDIIKLQHNIDDWTEQEYSKHYKTPQKPRTNGKYAKQIPDEYFTTISPINNYETATNKYNYELYDHEGSSSLQYTVTDNENSTVTAPHKEYNTINSSNNKYNNGKNEKLDEIQKLHIYTAAVPFRSRTTTPTPWGQIQTSISPLTKEKVYVVTSKPWREIMNATKNWYDLERFESKKTNVDNSMSIPDDLPFKSPRFSNRPPFGFTASSNLESVKADSSYSFSKNWHQKINDLEARRHNNSTLEGS